MPAYQYLVPVNQPKHESVSSVRYVSITATLIVLIVFSWLYMQWTHELGHILTGLATGAQLDRVILNPFKFSMTRFSSNPHPHITTWGGPVLGVLLGAGIPLLLAHILNRHRFSLRIIAAFVLLANGLYIGLGAITPFADAQDLIRHGSSRWSLAVFGLLCCLAARLVLAQVRKKRIAISSNEHMPYIMLSGVLMATGLLFFQ